MENSVIKTIFENVTLSEEQAEIVARELKQIVVPKGRIILSAGQLVPYKYYVYSGCLRAYFLDDSGKEHTIQFVV